MRWLKRAAALLVIVAVLAVAILALMPKPLAVDVAPVVKGHFEQTVDEDGRTRVRDRYTISAPIAGTMLRIALKAGDEVARDMPLATIVANPSAMIDVRMRQELTQRVGAAESAQLRAAAAVERARATLDQARADLERTRVLTASEVAPRSRLEHDELQVKVSTRALEAAMFEQHTSEHELEQARAALINPSGDDSGQPWIIRSPVAGRVFRVMQDSEGPVAIGAPVLEIGNPRDIEVVVDVLSTDAVSIAPSASAKIERWGRDRPLDGRVRYVEPSAFTKVSALGVEEQRVNVVIDIVSPNEEWSGLGDGYRVDARITAFAADDALKLPISALFREGEDWKVFVASGGVAHKRTIQVLRRTGTEAMIGGGVAPGDAVIVYPAGGLRDGAAITVE